MPMITPKEPFISVPEDKTLIGNGTFLTHRSFKRFILYC